MAWPLISGMLITLMLSVDELNPVKVLCGYTQGIVCQGQIAWLAGAVLFVIAVDQRHRLIYDGGRLFLRCTLNNIFFKSVEVVGCEHVPENGPLILTGNHNNQFVDG